MDTAAAGEAGAAGNSQSIFLSSCSGLFHMIPQELGESGLPCNMAATDHWDCSHRAPGLQSKYSSKPSGICIIFSDLASEIVPELMLSIGYKQVTN